MADNFVTKEPALIVTVSGEVADEIYVLFLALKQSLALTNLKKIERWKICFTIISNREHGTIFTGNKNVRPITW